MADEHRIASAAELRRLFVQAEGLAAKKSLPKLDRYARVAASPGKLLNEQDLAHLVTQHLPGLLHT